MIAANELRIGNWVYETSQFNPQVFTADDFWQIAGINNIDKTAYDQKDNITQFDYLYPIPITPEILEKSGLEIQKGYRAWGKDYDITWLDISVPDPLILVLEKDEIKLIVKTDDSPMMVEMEEAQKIKYLHQLQNLYFALTGEELQITL